MDKSALKLCSLVLFIIITCTSLSPIFTSTPQYCGDINQSRSSGVRDSDLLLYTDEDEKYVQPGEQAKYTINIKNNGNLDFMVALSYSDLPPGWSVDMATSVPVKTSETEPVDVFVTAPGLEYEVKAESRQLIIINGSVDTAQGEMTSSVGIVGVVDTAYCLNVTVTPEISTTSPGGTVSHLITIKNLGNSDDTIKLSPMSLDLGWNLTFPKGDTYSLEWKENITVELQLTVPTDALTGTYSTILQVTDSNPTDKNEVSIKTVIVTSLQSDFIIEVYNDEYDLYMSEVTQTIASGRTAIYNLRVTNDGYSEDTAFLWLYLYKYVDPKENNETDVEYTLSKTESDAMFNGAKSDDDFCAYFKSVQSSPGAFSSDPVYVDYNDELIVNNTAELRYLSKNDLMNITHLKLRLQPGQSAWIQVEINLPNYFYRKQLNFAVDINGTEADTHPDNNQVDLSLEIKLSDLTFDTSLGDNGIDIIGERSEENPQLNLRAKLRNIGDIDALDIEIGLFVDGQLVDIRRVKQLMNSTPYNYKEILISFTWKPVGGTHVIQIVCDPNNTIPELNEFNNDVKSEIEIKNKTIPGDDFGNDKDKDTKEASTQKQNMMLFLILGIVILLVVLAVAFILFKRTQAQ